MTIQITGRHVVGGAGHEHIAEVSWVKVSTNAMGNSTREVMVAWLDDQAKSNTAIVEDPAGKTSNVGTVHPENARAFIRSYADGDWNDNLLALPTY